jgi:hypothetical protein
LTQESYRTINLFNWSGGIVGRRRNPLRFTEGVLAAGENVDVADGALYTRPGSSIMSSGSLPAGEVRALANVRFPTNESSYLVAQVKPADIIKFMMNFDGDYKDDTGRHVSNWPAGGPTWNYWGWALESGAAYSGSQGWRFAPRIVVDPFDGHITYPGKLGMTYGPHPDWNFGYDQTPHLSWKAFTYIRKTFATDTDSAQFRILENGERNTGGLRWNYRPSEYPDPDSLALTLYDSDGNGLLWLSADVAIPDNEWWRLQIECIGGTYRLRADPAADWTTGTVRDEQTPSDPLNVGLAVDPLVGIRVWNFANSESVYPSGLEFDVDRVIVKIGSADSVALGDPPGNDVATATGLFACPAHLPTSTGIFTKIYEFGPTCGVAKFAVLNDRVVITEGLSDPPLVWGGCMADDASDWMHPKAVLVSQDGIHYYDVSSFVCDADIDTVADVGGIRPWGWIAICTDMPRIEGFSFKMQTPNTGASGTTANTFHAPMQITDATDVVRQDLKGTIANWVQDSGTTGHFTDSGGTKVAVGPGNNLGDWNSSATYSIGDTVTFSGARYWCIAGNTNEDPTHVAYWLPNSPDIVPGILVEFSDTECLITGVTGGGSTTGSIALDNAHAGATVTAAYGLSLGSGGLTVNRGYQTGTESWTKGVSGMTPLAGYSIRIVVPGSELSAGGDHVQVKLKANTTQPAYKAQYAASIAQTRISRVSIVERDGSTANGTTTPTEITFPGTYGTSQSGTPLVMGNEVTSDVIEYTVDTAKDYLVTLDIAWATSWYIPADAPWNGTQQTFRAGYMCSGAGQSYVKDYGWGNAGASSAQQTVTDFTEAPFIYGLEKLIVTGIQPVSPGLEVAYTTDVVQLTTSTYEALDSVTVNQTTPGDSTIYHAVSLDRRRTFQVFKDSAWRVIVRINGTDWQHIDGSDVWQNASVNSLLGALRQALAISENRMDKTALEAITSAEWQSAGGFIPHVTTAMDIAVGMQADGTDVPVLNSYTVAYESGGQAIIEGFKDGAWTGGDGWTDNTIVNGARLGRDGTIIYKGAEPFEADYHVEDQVPGFWYRLKTNGTSPGCAITEIRYKAPCQPLANIGDGQPDVGSAILWTAATNSVNDISVAMADNTLTALASAAIPMTTDDHLYVGYLTRFNEIEITPYADTSDTTYTNNQEASVLSVEYWNGEAWTPLDVMDNTVGQNDNTLAQKGRISWTLPTDWRTNIPFDAFFSRGFWVRIRVSNALTSTTALSEVRVYGVPDSLKKYKHVACFGNRIAFGNRPDAPDQVDISRQFEEYGFSGSDSWSFRLGGQDQIASMISAWKGLLVGKTESFHYLAEGGTSFETVEAARHVPINSSVVIKAPVGGFDYGDRYGLFFINRYGAFVSTGLHVDNVFNTARGKSLSDALNWWDTANYPRLDLDNLHLACGEYWPAKNWIVWAVPMLLSSGSGPQAFNNRLIVYDLTLQAWLPPFTIAAASLSAAYHYDQNSPGKLGELGMYHGDYQGRIIRLFEPGVTSDSGAAISAWVETGWLDFGSPEYRKLLRMLSLYGKTAADPITVSVFGDGDISIATVAEFHDLSDLGSKTFALEQESHNVQGRFFKFRIAFNDTSEIYGLQVGTSIIREWGAL